MLTFVKLLTNSTVFNSKLYNEQMANAAIHTSENCAIHVSCNCNVFMTAKISILTTIS